MALETQQRQDIAKDARGSRKNMKGVGDVEKVN